MPKWWLVVLAASGNSCGGGGQAHDPTTVVTLPEAGAPVVTGTPLTGERTPPPFHLESKHVDRKAQGSPQCHATEKSRAADPKAALVAIATACKLKPDAAPFTSTQESTAASQSFDLKGAKGQCYRVAATTAAGVRSLVITLQDAEGAIAAEYHTDEISVAVPPEEALCFKDDATLKVSASVGTGSGAFAVQVFKEP